MLNRPRVINTDSLASSQWSGHNLAGRVNNVRCCAQRETYRSLLAPDYNRLTWLVCSYCAGFVGCACGGFRCSCWLVCCGGLFGRRRASLCKRQWRNQPADQSNDCSFHSDASFLIRFTPEFVTHSPDGRSFWEVFGTRRFERASQIR